MANIRNPSGSGMGLIKFIFICLSVFSLAFAKTYGTAEADFSANSKGPTDQGSSFRNYNAPLHGVSQFVFFAFFRETNKKSSDAITTLIEEKLSKIGKIVRVNLTSPVDLSIFDKGLSLSYEIDAIPGIECKGDPALKASLSLEAPVQLLKTGSICKPNVWSQNCFFNGNLETKSRECIAYSLDKLLKSFSESYAAANPDRKEKPTFYLFAN